MSLQSARMRYKTMFLSLIVAQAAALIGVELLFKHHAVIGPLAYAAAVLPALPILGMFAVMGRYLVIEGDGYARMLMVRQSLIASGFALIVATIWGFLESFGLMSHVDAYYIAVLWFAGLGLGACVTELSTGRVA